MLKLQRASAGSGKTYTLTENFITNLIALSDENGIWKLRDAKQIEEGLQHILAITFTNKATNEMKQRIIRSLSLLSHASSKNKNEKIPYIESLSQLTHANYDEIGEACKKALKIILNNYSNFHISTIDSFFQEILHTFAYEANISDSYQLEIDSSFVNDSALEETMQKLDSSPADMGNSVFWFKTIMKKEAQTSQSWNPFNKRTTRGSIYSRLRTALFQLEKEEFKDVKEKLDTFFNKPENASNLIEYYKNLENKALKERKELFDEIHDKRNRLEEIILRNQYGSEQLHSNFIRHLNVISSLKQNDKIEIKYDSFLKECSVFKKKYKTKDSLFDEVAIDFYKTLNQWKEPASDSYYKNWKIYGALLPYLGLITEIRSFLSSVLRRNNIIQLHDTSFLLKKIIGEEDAPFVYERLGNRIDNYLIDEFQDTSSMQWDVIFPLLNEGLAKNKSSLIIGDPKQSIYRFRNADYNLITKVVPKVIKNHEEAGFSEEDNTNWRSHTRIVKFNNYFFKTWANIAQDLSKDNGLHSDFKGLYSNVIQRPANQDGQGYVEVKFFDKESEETFEESSLKNIGPLLTSLLERGYRQKDIGILVNKNENGKKVVEALMDYNDSLPAGKSKIDFISEESLLISSSPAIRIILSVFEKISQPGSNKVNGIENHGSEKPPRRINWNKIKIDFNLYAAKHPELSVGEKIISFLDSAIFENSLTELMANLPTPSLTSLVDATVKTFMDESMKRCEAIYIASFQDLVNEYSASHHNDPASFLEWWKSRGCNSSVSTPEGTEAVEIMTIHKSKGLEFKCVILPFATDYLVPVALKDEWRWVEPLKMDGLTAPPVLPVKTTSELLGSIHENHYKEYFDQILTDKLNMYYVAFTRARNELYIFTKKPKKAQATASYYIYNILTQGNLFSENTPDKEKKYLPLFSDLDIDSENNTIKYGQPFTSEEIEMENKKDERISEKTVKYFEGYSVNDKQPKLRSKASMVSPSGE